MPSDPQLKLPTAPEVALFRALDAVIRADPVLKSVVKTFRSWEGKPQDRADFARGDAPALRLTPRGSPEQPWSPDSMTGTLYVDVEILTVGTCSDDVMNLWHAVKRAVSPSSLPALNALVARLQVCGAASGGAHKGLVQFSAPAFDPQGGGDGTFLAAAQLKIEYRTTFHA